MSASLVFSSAAMGRPFIFHPPSPPHAIAENAAQQTAGKASRKTAEILAQVGAIAKLAAVVPASRLGAQLAREMVPSGIPQLDGLTGGLARGCITEICGGASSGRTSVLLFALAHATQRGEVCALVDASDAFDPGSAAAAGMEMERLLWVRCGEKYSSRRPPSAVCSPGRAKTCDLYRAMSEGTPQAANHTFGFSRWESQLSQMLKVTDLLLQSNGFGMIALDLGDVPPPSARRIPLASWFRFRRAIEHTPTVLLVVEQQPIAGSCSSVLVKLSGEKPSGGKPSAVSHQPSGKRQAHAEPPHAELLDRFEITAELVRSRLERKLERKPVQSTVRFHSRAAWAG